MKLTHRCSAFAPVRVGAPPPTDHCKRGRGDLRRVGCGADEDDLPRVQQGAAEFAQRAGAGGLRAGQDSLPLALPLVGG